MLLLQWVLVVWLGPSTVVVHLGGPPIFRAVYLMIGEPEFDVSGQIGQYFEHKFFCGRRRVGLECQWVVVVFDYQLRML